MPLPLSLVRTLQTGTAEEAWKAIFDFSWDTCAPGFDDKIKPNVIDRNRQMADVDLFLATAGWDLWVAYPSAVTRTCDALADWWGSHDAGRAVLILDGLSLRETPWLLEGAKKRGYAIDQACATGAELRIGDPTALWTRESW